jgi:hypothetical protein
MNVPQDAIDAAEAPQRIGAHPDAGRRLGSGTARQGFPGAASGTSAKVGG